MVFTHDFRYILVIFELTNQEMSLFRLLLTIDCAIPTESMLVSIRISHLCRGLGPEMTLPYSVISGLKKMDKTVEIKVKTVLLSKTKIFQNLKSNGFSHLSRLTT